MTFQEALKKIDALYKSWGYPGVDVAGDAETDWIFQAKPNKDEEDLLPTPLFVNKTTGALKWCFIFEKESRDKMYAAKQIVF